jgi:hypothetical protein
MKNKFFLWLSLLITLSVVLHSCRNEDFAKSETNPQRNNADFFKHKSSIYSKAGVDYISILEAYNTQTNFIAQMPDQKGMPIWDKMQVVDTETTTGLMIPLSYDNETMSSILFATLDERNEITGVKDYDNALLKNIVYDERIDLNFREQMFRTFMHMDNHTFGTERFTNIPNDLFKGLKYDNENGRIWIKDFNISSVQVVPNETAKFLYIEDCGPVWSCKNHETWSNCDHCAACFTTGCGYTVIWIPDESFPGSPSFPGGAGGGGGGTPGSGTPPKDPCTFNAEVFYRMLSGCSGGGVNPDLDLTDDPCLETQALLNNPKAQQAIADVTVQAKKAALDINEGEIGRIEKNGEFYPADVSDDHHVTFNDITGAKGIYHSHTFNGAKMHSPPDIFSIFNFAKEQSSTNHGDAYVGMIGAIKCYPATTNCYRMRHYLIRFIGTASDLSKVITEDEMKKFNKDYRDREHELTEILPYVDFLGDELNNKGVEKLFFETLAKMGLSGKVMLQRIDDDGTINNINLDANGIPQDMPCL